MLNSATIHFAPLARLRRLAAAIESFSVLALTAARNSEGGGDHESAVAGSPPGDCISAGGLARPDSGCSTGAAAGTADEALSCKGETGGAVGADEVACDGSSGSVDGAEIVAPFVDEAGDAGAGDGAAADGVSCDLGSGVGLAGGRVG